MIWNISPLATNANILYGYVDILSVEAKAKVNDCAISCQSGGASMGRLGITPVPAERVRGRGKLEFVSQRCREKHVSCEDTWVLSRLRKPLHMRGRVAHI